MTCGDAQGKLGSNDGELGSVLIVDDDMSVRQLLSRILRRAGYDVFEAGDADAAVQTLSTIPAVDVVLVDKRMPGRDGEWLAAHISRHFPAIAIVLATGEYVSPSASVNRTVAGHLEKPFRAEVVRNAVADAMLWSKVAARHHTSRSRNP